MKKIAIAITMCLWALVTQAAVPMFSVAAQNPDAFASSLKGSKVLIEEGNELPVVDADGNVIISRLAGHLHPWAKSKGYLTDQASDDPRVFAGAMVQQYGEKIAVTDLAELSKAKKFTIPDAVDRNATVPADAPVVTTQVAPVAPATVPVSNIDREQIAKWVKFAQGNDERIRAQAERLAVINGQLSEKSQLVARLERELQAVKEAGGKSASVTALALKTARDDLTQFQQAMPGMVDGAVTKAVKPIGRDVDTLKEDVKGVKDSLIFKYGNLIYLGVAAAVLLSGVAILMGLKRPRATRVQEAVTTQPLAINSRELRNLQEMAARAEAAATGATTGMNVLSRQIAKLDERATTLEVKTGLDEAWHLSPAEREAVKVNITSLVAGETSPDVKLSLPGKQVAVSFTGVDDDHVIINGIDVKTVRPVKKSNVIAKLNGYGEDKIVGIKLPVVKLAA